MSAAAEEYVTRFVPMRAAKIDAGDDVRFSGYAIMFNSLSQDLGGFRERIAPSAVDRTLREGSNVDALVDHVRSTTTILGSTDSGLLRLDKDSSGLRFRVDPPKLSWVNDLREVVRTGLVRGMSFAFRVWPDGDEWDEENGGLVRTVTDMVFNEVSFVISPAYIETQVSARNAALDSRALQQFKNSQEWRPSLRFRERQMRAKGIV